MYQRPNAKLFSSFLQLLKGTRPGSFEARPGARCADEILERNVHFKQLNMVIDRRYLVLARSDVLSHCLVQSRLLFRIQCHTRAPHQLLTRAAFPEPLRHEDKIDLLQRFVLSFGAEEVHFAKFSVSTSERFLKSSPYGAAMALNTKSHIHVVHSRLPP